MHMLLQGHAAAPLHRNAGEVHSRLAAHRAEVNIPAHSLVNLLQEAWSHMLPWVCCWETNTAAAAFRRPYMHKVLQSVERLLDSPLPLVLLLPACLCVEQEAPL